jgi:hypothetical protein
LQPSCRPNKQLAGIQEAVLRTTERIIGDDSPTGLKLPHKATLRMLLFKYQIGAVMGKKGAAINEIRNKSGATVKLTTPQPGAPIVPCAEKDDELITVSFSYWCCVCYSWILLCSCPCWAANQCHAAGGHACAVVHSMHRIGVFCNALLHCAVYCAVDMLSPSSWLAIVSPCWALFSHLPCCIASCRCPAHLSRWSALCA